MNLTLWDKKFIEQAKLIASWSKDPSTKCGCVIVDKYNRVVSQGYNGFPRNFPDLPEYWNNRELKLDLVIHSEENALLFSKQDLFGCTLYVVPFPPCSRCAAKIVQAGITRIVAPAPSDELLDRWGNSLKLAELIYAKTNVLLELYDEYR